MTRHRPNVPMIWSVTIAALAFALCTGVAGGGQPPQDSTEPAPASPDALSARVRAPDEAHQARLGAAESLLSRWDQPDVVREVARLLEIGDPGGPVMLEAIAHAPTAPYDLLPPLTRLAQRTVSAEVPAILRAAASVRSRDAAAFLMRYTDPGVPTEVRTCAFECLGRLSGRPDLGSDLERWRSWLRDVQLFSEPRWRSELVTSMARRADVLSSDVRTAGERVVDALRRLYLSTAPDERSGLLTAMLAGESPDTRTLAFELASRELSASRRLDATVGDAALRLLTHPDPAVRARAAALVQRLDPPGSGEQLVAALRLETDAEPAAAMIFAATRWPGPEAIDAVFRWLDEPGPASEAAADALWSLLRAGQLSDGASLDRLLSTLRATFDERLTASECAMLGFIGQDADINRLRTLLRTGSPAIRIAAGKALVTEPDALDDILACAAGEPQLLDIGAQGVMMHRATVDGFRQVEALPAPSPEAKRRALLGVAQLLPSPDLLEVARGAGPDMAMSESYLTLLASPDRILSERADPRKLAAIAEGVILLARTRLDMDRADGAVAALDALPDLTDLVDHLRVSRLRALAMLCLDRIDEAAALNAPPDTWIQALERCTTRPFAPALAAEIDARFTAQLTPEETERFARLRDRIPRAVAPAEDKDFVGPPSPGK